MQLVFCLFTLMTFRLSLITVLPETRATSQGVSCDNGNDVSDDAPDMRGMWKSRWKQSVSRMLPGEVIFK